MLRPYRIRPIDIVQRKGWHGDEEHAIVVLVNDEQAARHAPLQDGDRVGLLIGMVGG
jgi:molybdopterin converting factor small subunit